MFSSCSVKHSEKSRFGISSHAINTQLDIFKRDFTKPSFKHAKIIFPSVAFLYSLSIEFILIIFLITLRLYSKFERNLNV